MQLGDVSAFHPVILFPFAVAVWDALLPGGDGQAGTSVLRRATLFQKACSESAAAWELLLLVPHYWCKKKKTCLKDPMSPLHVGVLLLGALSQGKVPQCMAELGTCTAGALLGPTVFLLERRTSFSYRGPDPGFMAAWWPGNWPTTLKRRFRTCTLNSRRNSVASREIGPTKGFINFSFPLPPDRGCAEILRVILLKPRGA